MAKVVTVFGAHGHLGALVAKCLASDKGLVVRAVDSDGEGQYNADIAASGAQLVKCNLNDVNSIKEVLSGSEAVFIHTVSDFRKPNFLDEEIVQGRNIADACAILKINHVVFCTNLNTIKIIGVAARHLVAKAEIEEYMRYKGLPLTSLIVPCTYEDLMGLLKPEHAGMNNRWLGK